MPDTIKVLCTSKPHPRFGSGVMLTHFQLSAKLINLVTGTAELVFRAFPREVDLVDFAAGGPTEPAHYCSVVIRKNDRIPVRPQYLPVNGQAPLSWPEGLGMDSATEDLLEIARSTDYFGTAELVEVELS